MASQDTNHFSGIVSKLEQTPQSQRPDKLITEIAQQMQQSNNQQTQQLGQELQSVKTQLVKACQQQG